MREMSTVKIAVRIGGEPWLPTRRVINARNGNENIFLPRDIINEAIPFKRNFSLPFSQSFFVRKKF